MQPARIGPNNVIEEEARIVTAPGRIVKSEAEFKGLGKGWYGSPAEFPETPAKPDKADAQAAELDALRAENAKLKAATAAAAPAPVKS